MKWQKIEVNLSQEAKGFIDKIVKENTGICHNCVMMSAVFDYLRTFEKKNGKQKRKNS